MKYETKLIKSHPVAESTVAFHFEKPSDFEFRAGQSIDLTLIDPPEIDGEGNTRSFSIASAPHEGDLMIATRMRDTAFKRSLPTMHGLPIELQGPFGTFPLHEKSDRPAILLAGGIGVTPFRSMLVDAIHRNLPHTIYLFYSNRRPEDAPWLDELSTLGEVNPHITVVPTMTQAEKSSEEWKGERGYITIDMLDRHAPNRENAVYYLAGPQAFVNALRNMLLTINVSSDDIKQEDFVGY